MHLPITNRGVNRCLSTLSVEPKFASTKLPSAGGVVGLTVLLVLLLTAFQPAYAQTEKVLYSFGAYSADGRTPTAPPLIYKSDFYGTTQNGGANGYGTVFRVTPTGDEIVLYSFCSQANCTDGANPSSGVIADKEGNLYGETLNGGAGNWGTVFKVTPTGEESVFYSFGTYSGDGAWPSGGLIIDNKGNLYGTTSFGGANYGGTVFKLTPSGEESVLYNFYSYPTDGSSPNGPLIMDKEGNLYSTTSGGGANGSGTVFKVTSTGEETVLYSFGSFSGDGINPFTGLVMDTEGNLYGTTSAGGKHKFGTAFKVTLSVETVIHSFGAGSADGRGPNQLTIDKAAGILYGTTALGAGKCYGTVFEMTLAGKETVLHHFYPNTGDGYDPQAGVVLDGKGKLFSTTAAGGHTPYQYGTLFEVTP